VQDKLVIVKTVVDKQSQQYEQSQQQISVTEQLEPFHAVLLTNAYIIIDLAAFNASLIILRGFFSFQILRSTGS
jgi:hypothetical protein